MRLILSYFFKGKGRDNIIAALLYVVCLAAVTPLIILIAKLFYHFLTDIVFFSSPVIYCLILHALR